MNIMAIVRRIIRQFFRDKRSMGLMFIAPLLVLTLVWLVLDGDDYEPVIAVEGVFPVLVDGMEEAGAREIIEMTEQEAKEAFEQGEADAYISLKNGRPYILLEGSEPSVNTAVMKVFQEARKGSIAPDQMEPRIEYYYGSPDLNLFDRVGSVLIGFFVFFFVFIIGGISFLRERTQGTLEKLLSTPIKRWEIVTGYLIGFGLFTIVQSFIIVIFSLYVFDMYMAGDFWQLLLVTFLLAVTALSLATLLSAFANNEFQFMQFIPVVIVPQVFFSGIFPLETLAEWLQWISYIMPLTYGAEALQQMMIKGVNLSEAWMEIMILIVFALAFYLLNIQALKKHRRL